MVNTTSDMWDSIPRWPNLIDHRSGETPLGKLMGGSGVLGSHYFTRTSKKRFL